uniref:FHA domain-containing protein n=1 Tax=Xiphophorus couchianus TaxID=32473 RepID=A0A3B5MJC1_9TELE
MPLHGKIVVIKRRGGDGTEFPLTAPCLFGRKTECDIRIQLPQVSKEHCRIDLNENKEVNASANPTRVNGEALSQSERLKHGDVITIVDLTLTCKNIFLFSFLDPHLKDGANYNNIQRSLEKTLELESQKDEKNSPFNDLCQMIKKSLDVKTPRKSSASVVQTPSSKFCTPRLGPVVKKSEKGVVFIPKKEEDPKCKTPEIAKKQGKTFQVPSAEGPGPTVDKAGKSEGTSQQRRISTPQKFTASEVIEQTTASASKSPVRRRSKECTPAKSGVSMEQEGQAGKSPKLENPPKRSPKNSGSELGKDLPIPNLKRKRVSFGDHLSPELFDKRLPPDSPLRKGASPRRSLSLYKPKLSLLRRVSVIKEQRTPSPKFKKSASPKTPTGKASPKSRSTSPAEKSPRSNPAQTSPKSRSASPKATSPAQTSPKSRSASPKATSPAQKTPKSRSASPKATSPAQKTPKSRSASPKALTSTTPVKTPLNSGIQTPSVQGRFSVSRIRTPSPTTAVAQQMPLLAGTPKIPLRRKSMKNASRRTSGVARSAVKVFQRRSGISRASMKGVLYAETSAVTPARKLKDHMSTGHADSPATILVGRAHKRTIVHPTGAAPKVVMNPALFKKDMKMDDDLTGLSEMFKTPVNEKRRRSLVSESSAKKTPIATSSIVEPSVLNTPEEPDEMMVSPLSLASTVKSQRYNSEAVQRLLSGGEEASFVGDAPASEVCSESKHTDPKAGSVKTPKQKPELPICLTGIKRIMKTPRQKAEPIDDLRGKLLKTPKQKPVQQECLTGIKRIMKTPRQKAEPLEDIRGNLLVTPKQKTEQPECLTGVKRIFATPKQKVEPLEDLWGKLLKTPNTPKEKTAPVVDVVGMKRLPKTPKQKGEPVEDNFGIKRLMKSPRLRGNPPVEDFEGLQELMEEPVTYLTEQRPEKVIIGFRNIDTVILTLILFSDADKDKSVNSSDAERVKLPEEENANTEVAETSLTQKKSVRGKRAKPVEAKEAQKAEETSNRPVPPPVRGRRGNKMEATASPPAVEAQALTEISNEAVIPQISEKSNEKTTDPVSSVQVTTKPLRGKKAKVTSTEPERDECPAANAETPQVIPSVGKPRRGRKAKPDVEEPTEVAEDTCLPVETKPPTRAKRGRRALPKEDKQIEDDKVTSQEPSEHQEPPKKSRRTRKPEQEPLKAKEDTVVPENEPSSEQSSGAAKPRRGGRKAKADAVKPSVLMADATEKPKRGRKGEQIPQKTVPAKNPEHEEISAPSPQVHKPNRATPVKSKVSQTAPAKRGRRGAALLLVEPKQEPASEPVVPAKRGRRVAAKPKADDGASGEANPTESSKDDHQDPKMTKKAVTFKKYLESHEIPKATSVKAVRGRKTKVPDQADTRGKDGTKEASSTEEKTLSHDVVETTKRGRRGAKVAEVVAEDIGAQKKNRLGRSAKK